MIDLKNKINRLKFKYKCWKQRKARGWDDTVIYELDNHQMKMINEKYKRYLELAESFIDLNYYTFEITGKEMTQKEVIQRIIDLSQTYLDKYSNGFIDIEDDDVATLVKERDALLDELFICLREVFLYMWW